MDDVRTGFPRRSLLQHKAVALMFIGLAKRRRRYRELPSSKLGIRHPSRQLAAFLLILPTIPCFGVKQPKVCR